MHPIIPPIIPADILDSANAKALHILFIFDLSLKDFLSVQGYIAQIAKFYPQIKIDLWINSNCTCLLKHKQPFEEKLFIEFLQECSFINSFYVNTCSSKLLKNNLISASQYNYSAIILLPMQNISESIKLAKKISGRSFLVGISPKVKWYNFVMRRISRRMDCAIDLNGVSENLRYDAIFKKLFSEQLAQNYKPALVIPRRWITYAKLRFMKWGIDKKGQRFGKVFFINAFNDDERYGCSFDKILKLITDLKRNDAWGDINFVLHAPPSKLQQVRKFFAKHSVNNLYLFSADNNFYQVPSILSLCDGVFSVDGFCSELSTLLSINSIDGMDQRG
jgi:ADP-heptose:LPS heptosyltransferase